MNYFKCIVLAILCIMGVGSTRDQAHATCSGIIES